MSKREGRTPDGTIQPVYVCSFKELGYLPEAMINYLALLGWSFDDKTELMSRDELISRFSLDRVRSAPASWDYDKLKHFNATYIRKLSVMELSERLIPYLKADGINADQETLIKIAPLIQERLTTLNEATSWIDFFFIEGIPSYKPDLLVPKKLKMDDAIRILRNTINILVESEFADDELEAKFRAVSKDLGYKLRDLFHPVRVAISGRQVAPPILGVLEILGKEKTLLRLKHALAMLEN